MTATPHEPPQHQDPRMAGEVNPVPAPAATSPRAGRRSQSRLTLLVAGTLVVGLGLGAVGGASARAARTPGGGSTPAVVGGAPLELGPGAPADATRSALWPGGADRRTFTGRGLSQEAGSAHVWAFDVASAIDPAVVTRAAQAFGLAGEPTAQWGSWLVGSTDGSGPSLSVGGDGQATLSYSDPTAWCVPAGTDVTALPVAPATAEGPAAASAGSASEGPAAQGTAGAASQGSDGSSTPAGPPAGTPCPTTGLSSEDAVSRARDLLTAAGVQLGDARFTATGSDGQRWVQAEQVVGGSATGVIWSVAFVGQQVQQAWGPLAGTVDLGEYALVSPADAVARLADPRFAGTGLVMPMNAQARGASADAAASGVGVAPGSRGASMGAAPGVKEPASDDSVGVGLGAPDPAQSTAPTAVPLPTAGAPLSWGVRPVVLVAAELTLAATPLGDGAMVLLPTYRFTDADDGTWQVPAVSDAALGLA